MAEEMLKIKRIYDSTEKSDGVRVLVDRLWPRGISKERAHLDLWLKEIGPSNALRKWFGHDPKRWAGFAAKYRKELAGKADLVRRSRHSKQKTAKSRFSTPRTISSTTKRSCCFSF
jgi:uncharacterized protein YeaO (DUF488 family)